MRGLALLTLVMACEHSAPCDTAPYRRCAGGAVFEGGCGGESIVATCAKGCIEDGMYAALTTCPLTLCRESLAKKEGDPCESATDCLPTPATWSNAGVVNTYLTCDVNTKACVATAAPVVAGWLDACSPSLIAQMASDGGNYGFDSGVKDSGCSEGWCAVYRAVGTSCIANACTRGCTGDQECPRGSTCEPASPSGCDLPQHGYCKPGGPAGNGFSCR
jgi:hypothetical protein